MELDRLATRYGQRPSEILGIENDWIAYQVDLVSALAGSNAKKPGAPPAGGYRKPMASKRVKIPESGVW